MVYCVKNEIFPSNTYIVCSSEDITCLIIDPGLNEGVIDEKIVELGKKPIGIIATHGHFDHIGSVTYFKEKYNILFYMHEKDFKISQSANFFLKIARVNYKIRTPKPDVLLKGNTNEIRIENFVLKVHNYPGHSEGGVVIEYNNQLFTGDLFYKNGLGFNGFPGENKSVLRNSISKIFNTFDDPYRVYPGHGESESIGFIKKNNLELLNFINQNNE